MSETTKSRTVYIVGFADSWTDTPFDEPGAEFWGLNNLHSMTNATKKPWSRWFQLHDVDKHHPDDGDAHLAWLSAQKFPVLMFEEHIDTRVSNAQPYPKADVIEHFGGYFTNSISWMIALAIQEGYEKIGVYGVDMAQDSEYGHQRPSCEYFLGWAKGAGIEIDIAQASDLLKSPFLYGAEDGGPMRRKFEDRHTELTDRKKGIDQQIGQLQLQSANLAGALEDTRYYLRAWSLGEISNDGQRPQNKDGQEPQPAEEAAAQ